jgi:hypothetical protein
MLGFVRDILDAAGEALVAGVVSIGAGPPFVEGIGLESSAGAGLGEDRWATGDVDRWWPVDPALRAVDDLRGACGETREIEDFVSAAEQAAPGSRQKVGSSSAERLKTSKLSHE